MTYKPDIYKAERFNTRASVLIEGLSGTGKTGLALIFAYILAGNEWDKVGMVDTENRSSNLYIGNKMSTGDICESFLKIDLTAVDGFKAVNYVAATQALVKAGAKAVIQDSITHAWQREGGVLDTVNELEAEGIAGGKFRAWGDPSVVENKNALFTMLRNDKTHIISTVRVKEKFGMSSEGGKSSVISLGEQQQTQDGVKYEPDLLLHMIRPGSRDHHPIARVVKTRYPMLELNMEYEFTPELILDIKNYLEEGADPEELITRQKESLIADIVEYCSKSPNRKMMYDNLKAQAGYKDTGIKDVPTAIIKSIYDELTN